MEVFKTVKEIQPYLRRHKAKTIGFVATMGALHKAHMSLIEISKNQNDLTICSIFINPKQFNKKEDFGKYPRNTDVDVKKLQLASCDAVFMPSVEEMYPVEIKKNFHFGLLSEVMEAEHRPGHFNGVAIVLQRFFEILNPTHAYFGEKDFQQLAVVRALVKEINSPVKVVGCPICREENGLAMSSRNERLTAKERELAGAISKALTFVREHKHSHTVAELKEYFMNKMAEYHLFQPEYFEIADKNTLKPITNWGNAEAYMAFTAVVVNGVRLIDNMTINN